MRLLPTPITAPAIEPVSSADCKGDARIDGTEFDDLLPVYITAARQMCEHELGAYLINQVRRAELVDWPCADDVIAINPATSAAVTYWSGSAWAMLATDQYVMVQAAGGVSILPTVGASWPALPDAAGPRVQIDVSCGYGAAADAVPAALRLWIRAHVVSRIDAPGALSEKPLSVSPHLAGLLDPYRVHAR